MKGNGADFVHRPDIKSLLTSKVSLARWSFCLNGYRHCQTLLNISLFGWRYSVSGYFYMIHGRCWGGGLQLVSGGDFRNCQSRRKFLYLRSEVGVDSRYGGGAIAFRELMRKDHTLGNGDDGQSDRLWNSERIWVGNQDCRRPLRWSLCVSTWAKNRSPDVVAANKKLYNATLRSSPGMAVFLYETWYQIKVG